MVMHLVLLGDSTIDNQNYTKGELSVEGHLRRSTLAGTITRLATDGHTTSHIPEQLEHLPDDATHLVLSVGGNDALMNINILERPALDVWDAVRSISDIINVFKKNYRKCLDEVLSHSLPTVVCTIYNGAFESVQEQKVMTTMARLFNDVIIQCANDSDCPVIDLRTICTEREDYFNPIEPSAIGGEKIAKAIIDVVA
jgi:lysophospholipase L1-like esterase